MNSKTTKKFRKAFSDLPKEVQNQAREAYLQFKRNPWHPSLRFKPIHSKIPIFSVRIGKGYRAVGQKVQDRVVWFWIGSHSGYDDLLSQL